MDSVMIGRLIITGGVILLLVGGLFLLSSRVPFLNRFGSLPGDIRIQNGNFACFAPIMSMCLLSILLTIIVNVAARIFAR